MIDCYLILIGIILLIIFVINEPIKSYKFMIFLVVQLICTILFIGALPVIIIRDYIHIVIKNWREYYNGNSK